MEPNSRTRDLPEPSGGEPARVWPPHTDNGYRDAAKALAIAVALAAAVGAPGAWMIYGGWSARHAEAMAAVERAGALERLLAAPAGDVLPTGEVLRGQELFANACAACHKADGTGVPGLGKDLVHSTFVASLDDDGLHRFVAEGRAATDPENTTKIPMPPRGGRADLTDDDLRSIVVYMRALQDPRRMPELPAVAAAPEPEPEVVVAADIDPELAEYIASGTKLYAQSCASCHGKNGKGVAGLGKDLVNSEFCKSLDDDSLLEFVKKGRDPSDPANTSGVGMPAKGGNPALSDDDILDIIAYLRSLQDAASAN